jgi:DHA1 family multidrug resistance protein-like MFS transporter
MADIMREAPFGQLVRLFSGNRFFQYPEEKSDFACPTFYRGDAEPTKDDTESKEKDNAPQEANQVDDPTPTELPTETQDLEKVETARSSTSSSSSVDRSPTMGLQRTHTLAYTAERYAIEQALSVEKTKSRPIIPARTADNTILVDWYTTDDPANPQNWSQVKKFFVALQIDLYTFVVYAGSSIYVSSEILIMARFGVAEFKASLGLALYVLGYGLGPLIFSPMSEIPAFGRNVPYIATVADPTPKCAFP